VLDLLFTDASNPRSLRFQLDALAASCDELATVGSRSDTTAPAMLVEQLRSSLDRVDTEALAGADVRGRRVALEEFCGTARQLLADTANAVAGTWFTRLAAQHRMVAPAESPRARS
ncbi:MAG: alpha-E domain-containing protein, partial [Acidimicrobiales bacterium]|nr:alpha-E domain-containing protein [Acidimicrobiales bacterium]